jgi:hypothetical protein
MGKDKFRIADCETGNPPEGWESAGQFKSKESGDRRQEAETETGRDGDAAKSIWERLSRRFTVSPLLRFVPFCL